MSSNDEIAVSVKSLTKTFKIPLESHTGIKQKIINWLKGRKGYREFTPLNDISFDIKKGEFFGIVGRNGSGKSTLLKTIAGIYSPDKGAALVNGKLVPFIELGVGFNAELSGRENVFLNGALLGFSHSEMEAMYDEIVDFAELHDFMEERLKNYSSGMQVRLAFSIAIRAKGDILLLDEVLAVGDEAFQRKCYEYFNKLKRDKKTVILVTHSMSAVESFCTRAMLINNGTIVKIGNTHEVANEYSEMNVERIDDRDDDTKTSVSGITAKLHEVGGQEEDMFLAGSDMVAHISWKNKNVENVGVAILKSDGMPVFATNTFIEKKSFKNRQDLKYRVNLNLSEGDYIIVVGLYGKHDQEKIDFNNNAAKFRVNASRADYKWSGVTKLQHEWDIKSV